MKRPPLSVCRAAIKHQMAHYGLTSIRQGRWAWGGPYSGQYGALPELKAINDPMRAD